MNVKLPSSWASCVSCLSSRAFKSLISCSTFKAMPVDTCRNVAGQCTLTIHARRVLQGGNDMYCMPFAALRRNDGLARDGRRWSVGCSAAVKPAQCTHRNPDTIKLVEEELARESACCSGKAAPAYLVHGHKRGQRSKAPRGPRRDATTRRPVSIHLRAIAGYSAIYA